MHRMRPTATYVARSVVCVSVRLTHVSPRNHVLDAGQDWTNEFTATRGDRMAMWPFAEQLSTFVIY